MLVDGSDPDFIRERLEARKKAIVEESERRMAIIIAGVMAIQSGSAPLIVRQSCEAHLPG